MKKLIACISFFFLISCHQKGIKEIGIEEKDHNVDAKLVTALMDLWESGDTLQTIKIFSQHSVYSDIANGQEFKGVEGINKYISHFHQWSTDIKMTIRNKQVSESFAYVEWTLTGIQSNPIPGRVPVATHNKITLNGVSLLEFKNDKIEHASDYMDVLGFVLQLGSSVELPGGVVIGK